MSTTKTIDGFDVGDGAGGVAGEAVDIIISRAYQAGEELGRVARSQGAFVTLNPVFGHAAIIYSDPTFHKNIQTQEGQIETPENTED